MALFDLGDLRKSVAALVAEVRGLRATIQEKQREYEDIANAPAARSDVKALYEIFFQQAAADYRQSLTKHLEVVCRKPKSFMPLVPQEDDGFPKLCANTATYLRVFAPADDGAQTPKSMERSVVALLGETIKAQLFKAIDAMPFPNEGLPMAERPAKLAKLSAEIEKLIVKEEKLATEARHAGVVIE